MPPKRSKKVKAPPEKEPEQQDTGPSVEAKAVPEDEGTAIDSEAEKQKETTWRDGKSSKDTNGTKDSSQTLSTAKRKAEDQGTAQGSRKSARGAPKAQASPVQLLNFLLGPTALEMCRPEDERKDLESRGKDIRTYAGSQLSPFEELLCAIVLSRPISHRLGLRTIRTILNEPYNFTSPKAVLSTSPQDRHQAMFDARTQHKDKTATQIGLVAQVVADKFSEDEGDVSLDKVRSEAGKDWDTMRDLLQGAIKGLGKTGLDIFFRRVQWLWPEAYPFVDERTARGVEKLGLPKDPEELKVLIDESWGDVKKANLPKDQAQAKRRVFVVVCERATSADLEGKADDLKEAAAAAA